MVGAFSIGSGGSTDALSLLVAVTLARQLRHRSPGDDPLQGGAGHVDRPTAVTVQSEMTTKSGKLSFWCALLPPPTRNSPKSLNLFQPEEMSRNLESIWRQLQVGYHLLVNIAFGRDALPWCSERALPELFQRKAENGDPQSVLEKVPHTLEGPQPN